MHSNTEADEGHSHSNHTPENQESEEGFLAPHVDTEEGRRKERKNGTLASNTGDLVG